MKTLLIIAVVCVATFLTGCRTVAVVDHGRPAYVRSGYYGSPGYYGSSRYVTTRRGSYGDRYYGSRYSGSRYSTRYPSTYYRTGYSRGGYYSDGDYRRSGYRSYRGSRPGATVILR